MKRIAWTVVLSVVGLIAVSCTKVETDNTPEAASDEQPVDSGPSEPAAGLGPAEQPAVSETAQQPAEDGGDGKREQRVAGAIGRALLKGITGGSESEKNDPSEAPPI